MMRFNFFCHGLLWIVEDGNHLELLIPDIPVHDYRHGQPDDGVNGLKVLAHGATWEVTGIPPSGEKLLNLLSPGSTLILRKSAFQIDPSAARNRITLPMPDLIRKFRGTEVPPSIAGMAPLSSIFRVPRVSHDVLCFSYTNLRPDTVVVLKSSDGTTIPVADPLAATWCVYAQPSKPEPVEHDIETMNGILTFTGTQTHPDFKLALPTFSDQAHEVAKAKGFSRTHLLSLLELTQGVNTPETDKAGCHAAALAEDPV